MSHHPATSCLSVGTPIQATPQNALMQHLACSFILIACFLTIDLHPETAMRPNEHGRAGNLAQERVAASKLKNKDIHRLQHLPLQRIVDKDKKLCGYIQAELYAVKLRGKKVPEKVKLYIILDPDWERRGFITGAGSPFKYGPSGKAVPIEERCLFRAIKAILGIQRAIFLEPVEAPKRAGS